MLGRAGGWGHKGKWYMSWILYIIFVLSHLDSLSTGDANSLLRNDCRKLNSFCSHSFCASPLQPSSPAPPSIITAGACQKLDELCKLCYYYICRKYLSRAVLWEHLLDCHCMQRGYTKIPLSLKLLETSYWPLRITRVRAAAAHRTRRHILHVKQTSGEVIRLELSVGSLHRRIGITVVLLQMPLALCHFIDVFSPTLPFPIKTTTCSVSKKDAALRFACDAITMLSNLILVSPTSYPTPFECAPSRAHARTCIDIARQPANPCQKCMMMTFDLTAKRLCVC